jgi:hypothetical protein
MIHEDKLLELIINDFLVDCWERNILLAHISMGYALNDGKSMRIACERFTFWIKKAYEGINQVYLWEPVASELLILIRNVLYDELLRNIDGEIRSVE